MAKIIGIKFANTCKTYYFSPIKGETYKEGDGVIVETTKGLEYAKVVFPIKEVNDKEIVHPLKPILRKADEKDERQVLENERKIPEALEVAEKKIAERQLDMKLVGAEYSFDGKKLVFSFTSDGRVDFRELVKDLASRFHVRIELRQIGIRDETKVLGGIAPCGRICCCHGTINDFGKVSIKMAKIQGLHLNPSKISGLCGRLMCCLEYENDYYQEVYKKVPKVGGSVRTPEGDGIVISNDMFKLISKVKISKADGNDIYKDFPADRLISITKNGQVKEEVDVDDEKISDEMKKLLD